MTDSKSDYAFTAGSLREDPDERTYSGALSFLRRKYTRDLTGVDVAVTGLPVDTATSNRPGARFGPRAIREASSMIDWERPYGSPVDPRTELSVIDYGDCAWDFGAPDSMPGAIEVHIKSIIDKDVIPLSLGGDHFVTYPVLKALHAKHGSLSLVHFDAHSDTWDDEGGARRTDHGTMFWHAAKEGLVDPSRSVQIGLRTENSDTLGFHVLDAPWLLEHGAAAAVRKIRDVVGDNKAYVTLDIDFVDPSYAPGTGTPVCGGPSTSTALQILRGLIGINIIGADVVEVAPAYDVGQITALAAATIAYEYLVLCATRPKA